MKLSQRHRQAGWILLAIFVGLGLSLEALLAFKSEVYLGAALQMRRELWTLAHAHGTLLALIHLAFANHLERSSAALWAPFRAASVALMVASILMPAGFFLGGWTPTESDPGFGIWLVPVGGAGLLLACVITAVHAIRAKRD